MNSGGAGETFTAREINTAASAKLLSQQARRNDDQRTGIGHSVAVLVLPSALN
ncbi:hypothetical protein [Pantoea sp. CCBC3-3-1]|uniref:hypothetical protein n=1 Tax=Pantoea sp. CCBC3-3-1 TaxID=2490851 RepID=UPI00143CC1AE|nr:hypothetical protein [Pantoea sp. CCBC3-3-1]